MFPFTGLQNQLEASPFLSVENLTSAKVDVFQAYLGAITIDHDLNKLQTFINDLLKCEPSSTFEEAPLSPSPLFPFFSPNLPSGIGTGVGTESPRSSVASPVYPIYTVVGTAPLGDPTSYVLGASSSSGTSATPTTSSQGYRAASTPPLSPNDTAPSSLPPTPTPPPSSSPPQPQIYTPPNPGAAKLGKGGYLAFFNEIVTKRGQEPIWVVTPEGPPHAVTWQASLSCKFFFVLRGSIDTSALWRH